MRSGRAKAFTRDRRSSQAVGDAVGRADRGHCLALGQTSRLGSLAQHSGCDVEPFARLGHAARCPEQAVIPFALTPRGDPGCEPIRASSAGRQISRSEEHTSELQSLMRISYAVFCLNKKNKRRKQQNTPKNERTLQT